MSWESQYQPRIEAQIENLTPLHDFVLVKPMEPTDTVLKSGLHMTADKRWRSDRPKGLRYGTVVRVGRGDRSFIMKCPKCFSCSADILDFIKFGIVGRIGGKSPYCYNCASLLVPAELESIDDTPSGEYRAPMHCKVGDVVIFPRTPNNEMELDGEPYVWLHEEGQVLAIMGAE